MRIQKVLLLSLTVVCTVGLFSGTALAAGPITCPSPALTYDMSRGNSNDANTDGQVSSLQAFLWQYKGIYNWGFPDQREDFVAGVFGRRTETAVKGFQDTFSVSAKGTSGYGKVGPLTRGEIGNQCKESLSMMISRPLDTATLFVATSSSLAVSLDASSPVERWVAGGSSDVTTTILRFTATSSSMALTDLRLQATTVAGDTSVGRHVARISLWDGSTLIAQKISPAFSNNVEDFIFPISGTGSFVVPANFYKSMTVKVDVAPICVSCTGVAGTPVYINFDGDGTVLGKNKAINLQTAESVKLVTLTDTVSPGIRYFKSVPTLERLPLSTSILLPGEQVLYSFKVTATPNSDISFRKVSFAVATSGVSQMSVTLPNFRLFNVTDNKFVNIATGSMSAYAKALKNYDSSKRLLVNIYASSATDYPAGEVIIPAGQSRTFELRATIGTDGVGDSVATLLLGDVVAFPPARMEQFLTVDTPKSRGNFIWSDLSGVASGTHSLWSYDWINGARVAGLPSTGLAPSVLADHGAIAPVTITYPNGGEIWEVGKTYPITWNGLGFASTTSAQLELVDTRYPSELGSGGAVIVNTINNGRYWFVVPSSMGSLSGGTLGGVNVYKVKIYLAGGGISGTVDESNLPFTIAVGIVPSQPDTSLPTVTILVPTADPITTTANSTITLSSLMEDNRAIATSTARWTNGATGASGTVTPTIYGWAAFNIPLVIGTNPLTVSVQDSSGNTGTDVITVTRTSINQVNDSILPVVNILVPTADPITTTANSTITLSSLMEDNRAIATSTARWTNGATGASGTVTPTIYGWAAFNIPLVIGTNPLTVSVQDSSGNTGTDVITVTRTSGVLSPPPAPSVGSISPRSLNSPALASILDAITILINQIKQILGGQ